MLIFPLQSREQRLRAYVRTARTIHLFTNACVPTPTTAATDFVEPARETGYQPIDLNRAAWRIDVVGPAVRARAAPARFTLPQARLEGGAGVTVRGSYVLDGDGELLWSEQLLAATPSVDPAAPVVPRPFEFLRPEDVLEITVMIDWLSLAERKLA